LIGKMGAKSGQNLQFHPLTPERWTDLAKLFGERGGCGGCWCMYWEGSAHGF